MGNDMYNDEQLAHAEIVQKETEDALGWWKDRALKAEAKLEEALSRPAPPADAATEAVQKLLRAMWLYPNYSLGTRGPMGLLVDAIGHIAPDVAERLRLGTAPEHLLNPSPFDSTPAPAPSGGDTNAK